MCKDCAARRKMARDAFLNARMGEAAKHLIKGAAEATGLKKKTGAAEQKAKRTKRNSGATG